MHCIPCSDFRNGELRLTHFPDFFPCFFSVFLSIFRSYHTKFHLFFFVYFAVISSDRTGLIMFRKITKYFHPKDVTNSTCLRKKEAQKVFFFFFFAGLIQVIFRSVPEFSWNFAASLLPTYWHTLESPKQVSSSLQIHRRLTDHQQERIKSCPCFEVGTLVTHHHELRSKQKKPTTTLLEAHCFGMCTQHTNKCCWKFLLLKKWGS